MIKQTNYPRWIYHAEKEAVIVHNLAEETALGTGWMECPVDPEMAPAPRGEASHKHSAMDHAHPHTEPEASEPSENHDKPKGKPGRKPKSAAA